MCCGKDGAGRFNDTWALGTGYTFMGFYKSQIFNTGNASVNYTYLYFNQSEGMWPPYTEIRIRLATSNSLGGPWDFVGDDGTSATWFNKSKNAIPDFHDNHRYIRYSADLISYDGKYTPLLENVTISYKIPPSPPYLIETYPENLDLTVDPSACIYLNFSEPMERTSVTVDTYYLGPKQPTGITFDWTWSGGDSNLRLCPQTSFVESKVVQVWVNGTDLDGVDLVPNPLDPTVVNPFIFATTGEPPYIDSTSPYHAETDVANDTDVVITWSEPMDDTSVTWGINQGTDPGGWAENWDPTDTVLTLSHAIRFDECDDLEFEVLTAKDKSGKDFVDIGAPNPWSFKIVCLSPYVLSTDPFDGEANVPVNHPITVVFSEAMDAGTLSHSITPGVSLTPSWPTSDELRVNHANFLEGTAYKYCIDDVQDLVGYHLLDRPYCFTFMTYSDNPSIVFTIPSDGSTEVDPSQDVTIFFSEEMNTASVTWTLSPNVPDEVLWTEEWGPLGQDVTLRHFDPMLYCSQYTFEVTGGTDLSGYPLIPGVVPNPWSFNTTFEFPCMMVTDPYDGETGVDLWKEIVITFDEPIDTAMPFVFDVNPGLNGTVWTYTWSNGDKTVTLNHSLRFLPNVEVFVQIDEAYDLDGNLLKTGPVPNPFSFTTRTDPNWPWIESTSPANQEQFVATDEPITILFSETMDTATVTWYVTDLDGPSTIVFAPAWSSTVSADDTLTLSHVEPLRECQTYWVRIEGQDLDGNPLQDHPTDPSVANPWTFETVCIFPVITSTDP
ncbi:MAG: Ig-like domain-containing protein, partial [Thermoplasmata archaeon]|nr:Ig-like domain-containing protein [Thermoplasmata archaeon]